MFPLRDINPTRSFAFVNVAIIVINCLVFLFELSLGDQLDDFFKHFALVPSAFTHQFGTFEVATMFISMFLHGGWMHLISNMWALYIFGDNIEDRVGHFKYIVFYLLCGVAAALCQTFMAPESRIPTVGASGAIAGVLGAYLVLFPRARVQAILPIFFIIRLVEIPAVIYLGFWFFSQFFTGVAQLGAEDTSGGGIAWWAHVGGFVLGVILIKIFDKGPPKELFDYDPFERYYR